MRDQEARYDRIAEGYTACWAPIHRPATLRVLDEVARDGRPVTTLLDVGCGTGALVRAAADRWPQARVTGVDVSAAMLAIAERESAGLPAGTRRRVRYAQAPADRLPFADRSVDVVVSAFVLQLVPSRPRALREMRRVLRPGGLLACVTWLDGGSLAVERTYDEALVAFGLEPRDFGGDQDVASPAGAIEQLRHAGFAGVQAHRDELVHRFTPEAYLGFVTRFDDEDLFASLEPETRQALEEHLLGRLRVLPVEDMEMCLPIAYVTGRRSDRR